MYILQNSKLILVEIPVEDETENIQILINNEVAYKLKYDWEKGKYAFKSTSNPLIGLEDLGFWSNKGEAIASAFLTLKVRQEDPNIIICDCGATGILIENFKILVDDVEIEECTY